MLDTGDEVEVGIIMRFMAQRGCAWTRSLLLASPHICISWAHRPNNDLVQAQPLCWSLIICISSITATSSINNKQEFVTLFEIPMRHNCAPHILFEL
jgi:hypothetical protein